MKLLGMNMLRLMKILMLVMTLSACSNSENEQSNHNKVDSMMYDSLVAKSKNGADIWSSVDYEIITDLDMIREVEASASDGAILINLMVNIENRSKIKAESFEFTFEVAAPFRYIRGSGHQGIDKAFLEKGDIYEFHCYYVFVDRDDLSDFIDRSIIKMAWQENGQKKQKNMKIPL